MTSTSTSGRQLNLVALLAFIVGLGLAGIDMYVVDISSTPDSPLIGVLLGLLPALTAILWVYPTVSWFYARGVQWPSETADVKAEISLLREDIKALSQRLGQPELPPQVP